MKELCKAMASAFPNIKKAVFDKENPHFKSKYATLGSVIDAIKPALAEHGLWFVQNTHVTPGFASVETVILHSSGESMSCGITSIPVSKNDAQGYGSALSYAKRYSLSSAFACVAEEDDDGNEACNEAPKKYEASSSFRKTSEFEIANLAAKACEAIGNEVSKEEMREYLTYWQTKAPLPSLEEIVAKREMVVKRIQERKNCG